MLRLYKMSNEEKKEMNFSIQDNYYSFKTERETLGFAKINVLEKIDIYIFILENKRGNGYGNKLFYQVLETLKEEKVTSFELILPLQNIIMQRIVEAYGGIEESRKDNKIKYRITL